MGVSSVKSEVMVPCQKTADLSLLVQGELVPQAKKFKYIGSCSQEIGKWS